MKSLLILRHAEADPPAGGGDLARELSTHGQAQAKAVGDFLRARAMLPQAVLCSSVIRARQTAAGVAGAAGFDGEPEYHDTFYSASAEDLLDAVHRVAPAHQRVLLVAHAPGVGELVATLCTPRGELHYACPPATLFEVIGEGADWFTFAPGQCVLQTLVCG